MLRIVLVQPGATDFDDQGRIKGSLDMPLSAQGADQVARAVDELAPYEFEAIYTSPCKSAVQTAKALRSRQKCKVRTIENLKNLDHGLWHGKLIEEVKHTQPKAYRQWQDHPEMTSPPEGESLAAAQMRVRTALAKLLKKHKNGVVALIVPAPLASVVRGFLADRGVGDLWQAECDGGTWELIDIEPQSVPLGR